MLYRVRGTARSGNVEREFPGHDAKLIGVRLHFSNHGQGGHVVRSNSELYSLITPVRPPGTKGYEHCERFEGLLVTRRASAAETQDVAVGIVYLVIQI